VSFTAEVKEELSRVLPKRTCCPVSELAALVRVEGTLHIVGKERFRLEMATETAPVARKTIKLLHEVFGLKTELTVRRSVLHRANNYLITVGAQPKLRASLVDLGILDSEGGLAYGITGKLVRKVAARSATCGGRSSAEGSSPTRTATSTSNSPPRPRRWRPIW
jgi:DNA-binding protein WhiA